MARHLNRPYLPLLERYVGADPRPRIERPQLLAARSGGPFIFVDELGGRWEVFDLAGPVDAEPHTCTRVETPSTRAAYRVFKFRDGTLLSYAFRRRERRDLTAWRAQRLQLQIGRARRLHLPEGFAFPPAPWEVVPPLPAL